MECLLYGRKACALIYGMPSVGAQCLRPNLRSQVAKRLLTTPDYGTAKCDYAQTFFTTGS